MGGRSERFGSVLRRMREGVGLTQEELAERTRLSVRAIGNLERGCAQPRAESVRRLVRALGGEERDRVALIAATGARMPGVGESFGGERLTDAEALFVFEVLGGADTGGWDPLVRAALLRVCAGVPEAVRVAAVVLAMVPGLPLGELVRRLEESEAG